jgi:hypothetical protein
MVCGAIDDLLALTTNSAPVDTYFYWSRIYELAQSFKITFHIKPTAIIANVIKIIC